MFRPNMFIIRLAAGKTHTIHSCVGIDTSVLYVCYYMKNIYIAEVIFVICTIFPQSYPPLFFSIFWRDDLQWTRTSSLTRFLDHTQRRITVGRTPLDKWSARRWDLHLTTHDTHNTNIHAPGGIRTQSLAAADLRLRPRGYRDRLSTSATYIMFYVITYICMCI